MPVINHLKEIGIEKIDFAGGEFTLYRYLKELSAIVKEIRFIKSIASNGSIMTDSWFEKMDGLFDWIGLSTDSPDESDEVVIGKHTQISVADAIRPTRRRRTEGRRVGRMHPCSRAGPRSRHNRNPRYRSRSFF